MDDRAKRARISRLEKLYEILHLLAMGRRVNLDVLAGEILGGQTLRQAERVVADLLEIAPEIGIDLRRGQDPDDPHARWIFTIGDADPEAAKKHVHEAIRRLQDRVPDPSVYSERYFMLKGVGLCRCKRPLKPGRSTCEECDRASKEAQTERFRRRRRRGLCIFCGEKARSKSDYCETCSSEHVRRVEEDRAERFEAGLCRECDAARLTDSVFCAHCSEANTAYSRGRAQRLADAGLCRDCATRPRLAGEKRCQQCIVKQRGQASSRYEKLKASGVCVSCRTARAVPGRVKCAACAKTDREKMRQKRKSANPGQLESLRGLVEDVDPETFAEFYPQSADDDMSALRERRSDAYPGRTVIWLGEKGRMVKVDPDYVRGLEGNVFDSSKLSAVVAGVRAARREGRQITMVAPYGYVDKVTLDDIEESIRYADDEGLDRPYTTGDRELDEWLVERDHLRKSLAHEEFAEREAEMNELIEDAVARETGDLGAVVCKIRDGHHRGFGALLAGEPFIWMVVEEGQANGIRSGQSPELTDVMQNPDEERRRLERVASTGDVGAQAKLLIDRARRGELSQCRLFLAADLGHEAAIRAVGPGDPTIAQGFSTIGSRTAPGTVRAWVEALIQKSRCDATRGSCGLIACVATEHFMATERNGLEYRSPTVRENAMADQAMQALATARRIADDLLDGKLPGPKDRRVLARLTNFVEGFEAELSGDPPEESMSELPNLLACVGYALEVIGAQDTEARRRLAEVLTYAVESITFGIQDDPGEIRERVWDPLRAEAIKAILNEDARRNPAEDDDQRRLRARPDPERSLWEMWRNRGNGVVPPEYMRRVPYHGSARVTVWRGIRKGQPLVIRPGDWIALSRSYAEQHGTGGEEGGNELVSRVVDARDVVWAGTDMNEWWWAPANSP